LPSGKFTANAAWLVLAVIAFNLTRAAASVAGPSLAKATTATIRRKLITVRDRVLGQAAETAFAHRLALARRLDRVVHPDLRTTPTRDPLTTRRQRHNQGHQGTPRQRGRENSHAHRLTDHSLSGRTTRERQSVDRG